LLKKQKKNDKQAADIYNGIIAKQAPVDRYTPDYYAMAYAGLARIAQRSGNAKRAAELYNKCLEYAEYKSTITEAKKYLDK
jgi:hypothetical protein